MSKEVMKLALEALNTAESDYGSPAWELGQEAITALREALAEQPAQQEPVAWMDEQVRQQFNAAIDFAIEEGIGAAVFLNAWREGDTSEWPEFEAHHGITKGNT